MTPEYKIRKASNNDYYFVLTGEDGREILASEMFLKKEAVGGGIDAVRMLSADDGKYVRKTSNTGRPYFVLTGADNQPVATGEFYPSKQAMEKGINTVKRIAPQAAVVDETDAPAA